MDWLDLLNIFYLLLFYLEEAQLELRLPGETSTTSDMLDDIILMAESEELKSLLMKVKEESKKVDFKTAFRKLGSWHPVQSLHGK